MRHQVSISLWLKCFKASCSCVLVCTFYTSRFFHKSPHHETRLAEYFFNGCQHSPYCTFLWANTQSGSQHCSSIMCNAFFLPRLPQISSAKNKHLICHHGCVAPFQSVQLRWRLRRAISEPRLWVEAQVVKTIGLQTTLTMCSGVSLCVWTEGACLFTAFINISLSSSAQGLEVD